MLTVLFQRINEMLEAKADEILSAHLEEGDGGPSEEILRKVIRLTLKFSLMAPQSTSLETDVVGYNENRIS